MMAEDLHDGEFWLPPKFLFEDSLMENKAKINNNGGGAAYDFGYGFFGPNSELSSPGESVIGSTEAESDEDEFLSGLTRKLALSCVSDDDLWKTDRTFGYYEKNKSWGMATSPQSTLSSVLDGGGCGCNMKQQNGSSRGSPTCPTPQPHTQTQTKSYEKHETAAWELLNAAAGEVAKMRLMEERAAAIKTQIQNLGVFSNNSLSFYQKQQLQQLKASQFQLLKRQQMMKQQQQQGRLNLGQQHMSHQNSSGGRGFVGSRRPLGLSLNVWQQSQQQQLPPPPQQQQGSGMRALFLGNPGAKRESTGTGVFLPRRVGTPTETLKKPVCSTVLLPNRVVQALNLNLEAMDANSQLQIRTISNNAGFAPNYALKYGNNVVAAQAQQRCNVVRSQPVQTNNELRLPQEWTY